MKKLTNEQLENLLTLADAATPGPWSEETCFDHYDDEPGQSPVCYPVMVVGRPWYTPASHASPADAAHPSEYHEADGGPGPFICTAQDPAGEEDTPNAENNAAYIAAAHPGTVRLLAQELLQYRAAAHATGEAVAAPEAAPVVFAGTPTTTVSTPNVLNS